MEVSCPHFVHALAAYYLILPSEASSNLAKFDAMRYGLRVLPEGVEDPNAEEPPADHWVRTIWDLWDQTAQVIRSSTDELVWDYGRGVVTLIGDEMWRVPKIASTASSTVSEHDINILNLDAQEETSRILIVVEDKGASVADAVKVAKANEHTTVIHVETDPLIYAPDSQSWWDVPVSQTSALDTTRTVGSVAARLAQMPMLRAGTFRDAGLGLGPLPPGGEELPAWVQQHAGSGRFLGWSAAELDRRIGRIALVRTMSAKPRASAARIIATMSGFMNGSPPVKPIVRVPSLAASSKYSSASARLR